MWSSSYLRSSLFLFALLLVGFSFRSAPSSASEEPSCTPPPDKGGAPTERLEVFETTLAQLRAATAFQGQVINLRPAFDGNDTADIEAALGAARKLRQETGQPTKLRFAPGRYHLNRPITLTSADSGAPGAPLVLEAAQGGPVVLTGSVALQQTRLPSQVNALIPSAAKSSVKGFVVPSQAVPADPFPRRIGSISQTKGPTLFLLQGNRPIWRSVWPKADYAVQQNARPQPGPLVSPKLTPFRAPPLLAREPALQAGGYWTFDWAYEENKISIANEPSPNGGGPVFTMPPLATHYAQSPRMRYRLLGGFSFLEAQGEMAYTDGVAAVYPWAGGEPVEAAVLDQVLSVSGAHDIRFDGLAFEGARRNLVTVTDSHDIAISNGYIGLAAGSGVVIARSNAIVVERTVITDLGESGISILPDPQQAAGNVLIADNIITRVSALTRAYRPGILLNGHDNAVVGNAISDLPHSAIFMTGIRNVILGNEMFNVDRETTDSGAVYAYHDLTTGYNLVAQNYFHDISLKRGLSYSGESSQIRAIYLDSWISFTQISNNLSNVDSLSYWINSGYANAVTDNIWYLSGGKSGGIYDLSRYRQAALGAFVFDSPASRALAACSNLRARFDPRFLVDGKARANVISDNFNVGGRSADVPVALAGLQRVSGEHEIVENAADRSSELAVLLDNARKIGAPVGAYLAKADRVAALGTLRYRQLAMGSSVKQ